MQPTQEVFEAIRDTCIEIWAAYDDTYGYASEKVGMVKSLALSRNQREAVGVMYRMFDSQNQEKMFLLLLSKNREACEYLGSLKVDGVI